MFVVIGGTGFDPEYATTGSLKGLLVVGVFAFIGILLVCIAVRRVCRHRHETHARYTAPRR